MVDAKEYKVSDIQPFGFTIEVLDDKLAPIAEVEFSVIVDGGSAKTRETDEKGVIKVPRPKSEIKLSLTEGEVSTTSEESAEEAETSAPSQGPADTTSTAEEPASEAVASEESSKTLSGKSWVSEFSTSKSLDDLDSTFSDNAKKFIDALKGAGADVAINATKRPKERAYLMHWSWRIVKENYDAKNIPAEPGVNINWWHGDQTKSKTAAQEMVDGYGINNLEVAPSLKSRHIEGKAIDMNISWSGDLKIKKKDGSEVTITTLPKDGTNSKLIEVGATYGVIHFKDVEKDKPHWSTDGK